uniref:Lamin B receptor n=1 Tax=Spodoptera frugiperda TaxID=7108 RepID=A0A6B7LZ67_SPOFR|nr:lamin B receptor [Spodoptera frugiperda]
MSTRSGRIRASVLEVSPPRTRKGVSPTRSPARTRKSSPPPSGKTPPPARSRSSGRKSPARKSPSRKPASKFPARKSPSRTTKETTEVEVSSVPKSPAKRPPTDLGVSIKLEDLSSKLDSYRRSTRSKRLEYSVKDLTSSITENEYSLDKANGLDSGDIYSLRNRRPVEEVAPRRSSRLRESIDNVPDIRRSLSKSLSQSKSISKSASKSLDTYSDEENSEDEYLKEREKSKSVTRRLATPLRNSINSLTHTASKWEFGGRIGSLCLILLIPATVFSILISCRKSCSPLSLLDLSAYKSVQVLFSLHSLYFFVVQCAIQAIFAIVPVFGISSDRMDESGTRQCFNAFFSSLVTTSSLFLLDYFHIINKANLLNEYLKLAVLSYIFAVVLSIVLYVKSGKLAKDKLNQYGNTGYTLYDFFMGRETHPFIKKLDVKIWISRISNITSLILLSLILTKGLLIKLPQKGEVSLENWKQFADSVELKPTILVFAIMQNVYILNFIMKEHKITTTFYWHSEGVGYLQAVASALYPYYFTTISKHVADTDLVLSTNTLISASLLYVLGFFIMLSSNNIKHEFRKNPLHLSLANVDSMPTFHGKKLLVSNLWGILRHPNYTGDILIHSALALPGIISGQYVAAVPAILTILVLMHRAWRNHERCKRRYGAAWQRYCKRVPSVLLPKIL